MGRRAKKAPVVTKKKIKLAKLFKCPFCANENVVECKMDFKSSVGTLNCRLCGATYQMPIHHLHEPIDVFSEWLDDCQAALDRTTTTTSALTATPATEDDVAALQPQYNDDDDDLDDDDDDDDNRGRKKQQQYTKSSNNPKNNKNNRSIDLGDSEDDDEDDDSDM